jgi:hypothetical protein
VAACARHGLRGELPRPGGERHRDLGERAGTRRQGLVVSPQDGQGRGGFAACDTQKLCVSGRSIKALVSA